MVSRGDIQEHRLQAQEYKRWHGLCQTQADSSFDIEDVPRLFVVADRLHVGWAVRVHACAVVRLLVLDGCLLLPSHDRGIDWGAAALLRSPRKQEINTHSTDAASCPRSSKKHVLFVWQLFRLDVVT